MGKFKVGDRVRVLASQWPNDVPVGSVGAVSVTGDDYVTVMIDGGDGFDWYFDIDEVTPLAEPLLGAPTAANAPAATPQQSTAGFTIPLVDDEPAGTVTLALTADLTDLHEELDEIIAKLKKIRKLQRQTGLAA